MQEGRAHAALVIDGTNAIGWCQFGASAELPNIRSRRTYEEGLSGLPDWRITCFFIDRERRREGIANLVLREALREIARLGGGMVEAYPEVVAGRKVSRSFLCSGTLGHVRESGIREDPQDRDASVGCGSEDFPGTGEAFRAPKLVQRAYA